MLTEEHPCSANQGAWCPETVALGYALRSLRDQCAEAGVPFLYKHGKELPLLDGVRHDWMP